MVKVYGFCDAGCRRRVPTYEEFLNSASIVKQYPNKDGSFLLGVGEKYKIAKTVKNATEWGFSFKLNYISSAGNNVFANLTLPSCSKYDEYLTIKFLDIVPKNNVLYVIAEANGKIEEYETDKSAYDETADDMILLNLYNATECYLVNEDAEITLKVENAIHAVLTSAEMDAILANATSVNVGSFYMYLGETTDSYKNGAVYRISEV